MRLEHYFFKLERDRVGRAPVVGTVDHGACDVLIHEEEQRQAEAESHRTEDCRPAKVRQRCRLDLALNLELRHCT